MYYHNYSIKSILEFNQFLEYNPFYKGVPIFLSHFSKTDFFPDFWEKTLFTAPRDGPFFYKNYKIL